MTKNLFKLMYTAHKIIWEFLRSKMAAGLPSGLIGHVTSPHLLIKTLFYSKCLLYSKIENYASVMALLYVAAYTV